MTTCCLLLGTQVHEARYADEQASKIGGAQMDLPGEVAAGKRLTNAVYFAVGAAFFFFLMMVTSVSGFSDFDDPDLKPKILNVLTILFLVSFTIAMVQSCRWRTPNSGITHWKRVGLFALILWGGFPLIFVSFSILQSGALFGDVVVGMIPSLIWFPISLGGYHLSENDGYIDSNEPVRQDSWFWEGLTPGVEFVTLEVNPNFGANFADQVRVTETMLGRNGV
jgi:hypothetical protein